MAHRDIITNVKTSSCKVAVILVRFQLNLNFLDTFRKKGSSSIKFNEKPSSGSRVVPCGETDGRVDRQTDRHRLDQANSRISQCCERV
jgi:hypothetical protein